MPALLFLSQRIPYPPTKGDKIRAFHILQHLRARYDIHLGCLVDDPHDAAHLPDVRAMCRDAYFASLDRRRAKVACLSGLLTGEALSVTFYRDRGLAAWVRRTMEQVRPEVVFVYSSNVAPYVLDLPAAAGQTRICDLVDVDSEKWRAYAAAGRPPMRFVHGREWRKVAALEARIAREFDWCTLVSPDEAALFASQHPAQAGKVRGISNGVDATRFDPAAGYAPPFPLDRPNFVFTGAMDYPPNVDAVAWFVQAVLPLIRRDVPGAAFHVVGANPSPAVQALAGNGIHVTGRVADVRPFMAHATACVAPMRIARGIQNKVLEAMAMARPTVVTPDALEGIAARPGEEVLLATDAAGFAAACLRAMQSGADAIGAAARRRVLADYAWEGRLRGFDDLLGAPAAAEAAQ